MNGRFFMNYYAIGQQIRKYRKAHGLSQEQIAEMVGISTTHMSHIETGNTKLSLPVLVDIATALEVRTDDLLERSLYTSSEAAQELAAILEGCSAGEAKVLIDVLKATKQAMEKYLK